MVTGTHLYLLLQLLLGANIITGVGIPVITVFPGQSENSVQCPVKFSSGSKVPSYMFLMLHMCHISYQTIFLTDSHDYQFVMCRNFDA
jgi:hypothetical protein